MILVLTSETIELRCMVERFIIRQSYKLKSAAYKGTG